MENKKQCLYCGEEIMAAAKKCRHCGEWLNTQSPSIENSVVINNNQGIIIADKLETSISTYIASHSKKFKTIFLIGYNLSDDIIKQHQKYASIKGDEKVLMAVNKIVLYPFSGLGIIVTDKFLYYRLVNHNFKIIPLVTMFKKKPVGKIPLSTIESLSVGADVMTIGGEYFGNQFIVNGQVIGLLPFTAFNRDAAAEELNQIFKAFNHNE